MTHVVPKLLSTKEQLYMQKTIKCNIWLQQDFSSNLVLRLIRMQIFPYSGYCDFHDMSDY